MVSGFNKQILQEEQPEKTALVPKVPIIDDATWIIPASSNPDLKKKAMIKNLQSAVDNHIANLVADLMNEYTQNKKQAEVKKINDI